MKHSHSYIYCILVLGLLNFLPLAESSSVLDFNQITEIELRTDQNFSAGTAVTVFLNTLDPVLFPSESCLAVGLGAQIFSRKLSGFRTENTRIVFNLLTDLPAGFLDKNYFLATQCLNSVDANTEFDYNFSNLSINFSPSIIESTPGYADASFSENALLSINNPPTVGMGQGRVQVTSSALDQNSVYKIFLTFSGKTGITRSDCIVVNASASLGNSIFWSQRIGTPQKLDETLNFTIEPWMTSANSFFLQFDLHETRQGVCNTETPFAQQLRIQNVFQAKNVFGNIANNWHLVNTPPVAEFGLFSSLYWSSVQKPHSIPFNFMDLDSDSNFWVSLAWHSSDSEIFFNSIILKQPLDIFNQCVFLDQNNLFKYSCTLDWKSVPLNDSNVVLDLEICDAFSCSVVSSSSFVVDNGFPNLALLSPLPGTHFQNNEFGLDLNVFDLETGIQAMEYSLNDSNFSVFDSNSVSIFNLQSGENSVNLQAMDFAGNVSKIVFSIFWDQIEELALPIIPPVPTHISSGGGGGGSGFSSSKNSLEVYSNQDLDENLGNYFYPQETIDLNVFSEIPNALVMPVTECIFLPAFEVPIFLENKILSLELFSKESTEKFSNVLANFGSELKLVLDSNAFLDCGSFMNYYLEFHLDQNGWIEFSDSWAFIFLDSNSKNLPETSELISGKTGFLSFESVFSILGLLGLISVLILGYLFLRKKKKNLLK
ncbi:MAG: hypothetical protein Q7S92_04190 [Candidatus Diapherotrites archaeon]|nr:hypothetical protein [Candidatus Diapherotrites archaeon]